ncbi:hypothetical protein WME79_18195 [Sorangium sp. So ce726]|uniref:hypothetical protein n=1 Tax=Sorangium sp. So ce726 TaxID=3133319 RepID=UPI003F5F3DE4
MSDQEQQRVRSMGGLALLDWLRPPPGFVTDAALGTTYSLDLVTCAAALVSLDGTARDSADFGLTAALRAMHRLAGRVFVVAQQGCVHAPERTKEALLPMLDRFVRMVRRPLDEGAFHPKVWLVRQLRARRPGAAQQEDEIRYVLVVGSRNLTRDLSWDLGAALQGSVRGRREANLHGVGDFVRFACRLADLSHIADRFADVDQVEWEYPDKVRAMRFGFHGEEGVSAWDGTILPELLERARGVLWISPFLDAKGVEAAAKLSENAEDRRLVAGTADLNCVAQTSSSTYLERLELRSLPSASEEPSRRAAPDALDADGTSTEDPELIEDARGLHAKAIAVWKPRAASVLIGSANLTRRGWLGANVEAWLLLEGRADLADALWAWSEQVAAEYHLPERGHGSEQDDDALDRWHHRIAARSFVLREGAPADGAELSADTPPLPEDARNVELRVGRLARLADLWAWTPGATSMTLAGCDLAQRSALLHFVLRTGSADDVQERAWLQHVRIEPALDPDARDRALLRSALPPEQFLEYLRGLLDDDLPDDLGDDERGASARSARQEHAGGDRAAGVGVEVLLRALARAPDPRIKVAEIGRALSAYLSAADAVEPRLAELQALWRAIEEAYT